MSDLDPQCPVCRSQLGPVVHETAMVWSCAECRGTFMPLDQLYAITRNETMPRSRDERVAAVDGASEQLPLLDRIRSELTCPVCVRRMRRTVFDGRSGIGIDTCDRCGMVWLDRGELERAEAWREARRAGLADGQ